MRVVYCSADCQNIDWNDHKYSCAQYIQSRVNIVICARAANRSISYHAAMERWYEMLFEMLEANKHPWEHLLSQSSQTRSVVAECLPVAKNKHWSELAWERWLKRGLGSETPVDAGSS